MNAGHDAMYPTMRYEGFFGREVRRDNIWSRYATEIVKLSDLEYISWKKVHYNLETTNQTIILYWI